ncbi:MAG: 50S ribosomal protein L6 [Thermodesulfobacteriota bacterium]
MSRVGKKPIAIPAGVEVKLSDEWIEVKGPKGTLREKMHPAVKAELKDTQLTFSKARDEKGDSAAFGLMRALTANMVHGVTEGFQKVLEIVGVGYRAQVQGKTLSLSLGYSNPVEFPIPKGVEISTEQRNQIVVSGIDKRLVGAVAAEVRRVRSPEPYKGKGVKYLDERIRRKVGKTGA